VVCIRVSFTDIKQPERESDHVFPVKESLTNTKGKVVIQGTCSEEFETQKELNKEMQFQQPFLI
jgi:hypothetical protein